MIEKLGEKSRIVLERALNHLMRELPQERLFDFRVVNSDDCSTDRLESLSPLAVRGPLIPPPRI